MATDSETERLSALHGYDILDTQPEALFDEITTLTARVLRVPVALISLLDADRQWFKSKFGLNVEQTPRDVAFCSHAIEGSGVFVVEDATLDPRFKENPLVASGRRIRFYAGAPLVVGSGHAIGTLCVLDDKPRCFTEEEREILNITARQVVAQLELRKSVTELTRAQGFQKTLQGCLAAIKMGFWRWNVVSNTLEWDQSLYELYGIDPKDFSGAYDAWAKSVHPDDWARSEILLRNAVEGKGTFNTTFRILTPQGAVKSIAARGDVIRDQSGRALAVHGFNWDITEENLLRSKYARLSGEQQSLFQSMREGMVIHDASGRIEECNRAALEILGLSREELSSRTSFHPLWQAIREDGTPYPGEEHPAMVALRTGETQSGVGMGLRQGDGSITWILINALPLFNLGEASPSRVLVTFVDITARKALEHELRATKAAEERANRPKSVFLATMSQEIRTPLNGIIGMSALLLESTNAALRVA